MTTIESLGRIGIVHDGTFMPRSPAQQRILAVLVAAGPNGLSDERLAHGVWGDELPGAWKDSIRQTISRMRRALPADAITSGGRHYSLALATDEIDVWQLFGHSAIGLNDPTELDDTQLTSLLADEPYPGTADSNIVRASIDKITAARVELLDRLRTEAPQRATPALQAATHKLLHTTWDENLVRAVVELHAAVAQSATALSLLTNAIERIEHEIGPVGATLFELQVALGNRAGTADSPAAPIATAPVKWFGTKPWHQATAALHRPELLAQVRNHLDEGRSVLLTGDSGAGKTSLTRRLAEQLHDDGQGNHIIWLVAQRDTSAAYASILAVFGNLLEPLTQQVYDTGEEDLIDIRRWAAIQDHIRSACPHGRITIVVDDAQWLDSHTSQFIEFWARSTSSEPVEFIVVGRHDAANDISWAQATNRLQRSGLAVVNVDHFSPEQLATLVGLHHPASTARQRAALARLLIEEGLALPVLAAEVIAAADPVTLALPRRSSAARPWGHTVWTSAVEPATADIAGVAALIGITFSFDQLTQFTEMPAEFVTDAIDELLDAELIVAMARPDQFSFRHALVQEAFAATVNARAARSFHERAADLARRADLVHERARHLLAVGPSVDIDALGQAIIISAGTHAHARSFLEAVHAYEAADRVAPSAMTARALARYTHAIERSGGDATTVRERAIDAAEQADDPDLMMHVVVDGADPGELLESEPQRIALIKRVPRERLTPANQLRLDAAHCRELALAGDLDEARKVHSSMQLTTADDHATGWLALWGFFVGSPPSSWPELGVQLDNIADDVSRARVRNVECARQLMLGDRAGFEEQLAALRTEPASAEHPARRWHIHLVRSMRATIDGRRSRAEELSNEAFGIGQRYGLAGAFAARTAQIFADYWLRRRHAELVPLLDVSAPDVADSLLATSARASALFTLDDRVDEARTVSEHIAANLTKRTQASHPAIAVLLAEAAAELPSTLRLRLQKILEPFAGHAVLVSAGLAHLGPAHRALGFLSEDEQQRVEFLRTAVHEADSWALPVWSVRCRLDLAAATGDERHRVSAQRIAAQAGPELTAMFFD